MEHIARCVTHHDAYVCEMQLIKDLSAQFHGGRRSPYPGYALALIAERVDLHQQRTKTGKITMITQTSPRQSRLH